MSCAEVISDFRVENWPAMKPASLAGAFCELRLRLLRPRLLNPGQKEELSADSELNKNKIKATSI